MHRFFSCVVDFKKNSEHMENWIFYVDFAQMRKNETFN
jgi:hypothetical protein